MGEWIESKGAFLDTRVEENTNGYSLRVNSACLMSYNEFIEAYGTDKTHVKEGCDVKNIIDIELEIKNEKPEGDFGYFPLMQMHLIPERKNVSYLWCDALWAENEPKSKDQMVISIKAGTTYTTHIPFTWNVGVYDFSSLEKIGDSKFELTIANSPANRVVDISL